MTCRNASYEHRTVADHRVHRRAHSLGAVLAMALFTACCASATLKAQSPPENLTAIRKLDRLTRKDGEVMEGLIATPNPLSAGEVEIKVRTVTMRVPTSEIASIVPRQTADEAYENWRGWIRKQARSGGELADGRARSTAELELARWCASPHLLLNGERPRADSAVEHLELAAKADPTHDAVYPWLLAAYRRSHDIATAPTSALDRELRLYFAAKNAGIDLPQAETRVARILLERLALPDEAEVFFRRVVESVSDKVHEADKRRARAALAEIYRLRGEPARAIEIWQSALDGASADEASFEPLYELAQLHLRSGTRQGLVTARQLLERAQVIQPEYVEILLDLASLDYLERDFKQASLRLKKFLEAVPGHAGAQIDLACVDIEKGQFVRAGKALDKVLTGQPSADLRSRALLARGMIAELGGQLDAAATAYASAASAQPDAVLPILSSASVLIRQAMQSGSTPASTVRTSLEQLRSTWAENRWVFGAASRLLALEAAARGAEDEAGRLFEFAVEVSPGDASLLELAGVGALRLGKLEQGGALLARAESLDATRPGTLNGLGYYRYQQGSTDQAAEFFGRALEALKGKSTRGFNGSLLTAAKVYAQDASTLIEDLEVLEVAVDGFDGDNAAQIDGWNEVELYGIEVQPRDGAVLFAGEQSKDPAGETGLRLIRPIESRDLERISVAVRVLQGSPRASLRLGRPEGGSKALVALSIERSQAGRIEVRTRASDGTWKELEKDAELTKSTKKPFYPGNVLWPSDTEYHTLEIRRTAGPAREKRSDVFDLWFDGEPVALNVTVSGLSAREFDVAIYGSTDAIGSRYEMAVDNFKVYRVRPGAVRRSKRK